MADELRQMNYRNDKMKKRRTLVCLNLAEWTGQSPLHQIDEIVISINDIKIIRESFFAQFCIPFLRTLL